MAEWWSDLTETVPAWLATLRSPDGLYKMSASAYHEESLDATTLAWDLHRMLRLYREEVHTAHALWFMVGCQNHSDGFFLEPFDGSSDMPRLPEIRATYLGCQVAALFQGYGGYVPQVPYKFYSRFLQPGAISRYMSEEMPWDTAPMGAGNMVDAAATMMRMNIAMGHHEYWHVITEMYRWLDENQSTFGFWGSPSAQGTDGYVQAGYHVLRGMHLQDGRKLKQGRDMLREVLMCLTAPSAPLDACHYMDCAVLLEYLHHYGLSFVQKPIAEKLIEDIRIMRRDDGGFSFSVEGAITNHNRYDVTPGEMESDLVGTVFYLQALRSALLVLGEQVPWGESATHGVYQGRGIDERKVLLPVMS